jgi:hypothetical protein
VKSGIIIFAVASLALASGCADFKSYMRDRGNDLADCFGAGFTLGLGVSVNARATHVLQVGIGFQGTAWLGFTGRQGLSEPIFVANEISFPMYAQRWVAVGFTCPKEVPPRSVVHGLPHRDEKPCSFAAFDEDYDRRFLGIGFAFHALLLGAAFEFEPREFADFLLGWFSIDFMKDDSRTKAAESQTAEEDEY